MKHMRIHILVACFAFAAALLQGSAAFAQSDTDRLREALRQAIAQQRALEDERTALQGQIAEAQRNAANLKAQLEKSQAQYKQAVDEFNKRLAERDDTLEKWKSAYDEAATVARTKDAERAQFESEAAAYKASTNSCRAKNKELAKTDQELLNELSSVTFGDAALAREPALGLHRVQAQNKMQDYTYKILDQTEPPSCVK
jgi:Skp family chaperone for outer membrane proteins